jgi:DNA-binding CsgD family transcriptional regulator/PAS domain-containing protein
LKAKLETAVSVDERMLAVIQTLYDAAMDENLWPKALQALTEYTGSQAATFWTLDSSDQPRLPVLEVFNFDPAFMKEYIDGMVPCDPTVLYLVRNPGALIVHDGLVITESEKDRHQYYAWHGRHSDTRFRMVGQVHPAPSVQAGVALHRTRQSGRYEPVDLTHFAFIHTHLQRAMAIGFRLGSLRVAEASSAELLDRSPAGILLLDDRERVVFANKAALALRSMADGIEVSGKGIALGNRHENAHLQGLILGVLSGDETNSKFGGIMRASRPSGKRAYMVLVSPMRRQSPKLSNFRPAVSVVIADPDAKDSMPVDRLQRAFGLTAAESKLAVLIGSGESLRSAAGALGVTYGTARARLAQIFEKTQTRRQGELVKTLLATLAVG